MGYMFRSLKSTDPYLPEWQRLYRRHRRIGLSLAICAAAFLVGAIAYFVEDVTDPLSLAAPAMAFGMTIILVFLIAYAVLWHALIQVQRWPCPRCRNPFYLSRWGFRPCADECRHCGLPEFAPCETADPSWEVIQVEPIQELAT